MKISYTQDVKNCKFSDIKIGDCFEANGDVYVKIPYVSHNSLTVNAFNLQTCNLLKYFNEKDDVYPLTTELKVTYVCEDKS